MSTNTFRLFVVYLLWRLVKKDVSGNADVRWANVIEAQIRAQFDNWCR